MQCPTQAGRDDLLIAFSAGRLSPHDEISFLSHLDSCTECRRMVESQSQLWRALDTWEPVSVSPDFDARVYARIAAEEQQPWYRKIVRITWSFRPAMPVAAACAALLVAFMLRSPVEAPQATQAQVTNPIDIEQVEQALDDVDMLKQLGVVAPLASGVHHQEPM